MEKMVYFDMDGTIVNLYQYPDWLCKLRAYDPTPYEGAAPLVDMELLLELLLELQQLGWKLGIISWLSKETTLEYKKAVTAAKKKWLNEWLPLHFDEMHFVQYGTRKDYIAKQKQGILFDDSEEVRNKWRGRAVNPKTENILEVLEQLIEETN